MPRYDHHRFHRKITRRVTKDQMTLITNLGHSDNLSFVRSKMGKYTLILRYEATFSDQLINLVLACVINFQILPAVARYGFVECLKAFFHIGCNPVLNKYTNYFTNRDNRDRTVELCRGLGFIVRCKGYDSKEEPSSTVLFRLNELGVPEDLVTEYLELPWKLNTSGLVARIKELQDRWNEFWKYRFVHHCMFCGLDLHTLLPITRRLEVISCMPCCRLPTCTACSGAFLSIPKGRNWFDFVTCRVCQTHLSYDEETGQVGVDSLMDDVHSILNRHNVMYDQNVSVRIPNTISPYPTMRRLQKIYPQPGSEEYGEYVLWDKDRIVESCRYKSIGPQYGGNIDWEALRREANQK